MIRAATATDAPAIGALLVELGYDTDRAALAARLARLLATGTDPIWLAEAAGQPVGVLALHISDMLHQPRPDARITALAVAAGARRTGVARALVAQAEAAARAAGWGVVELTTGAQRTGAHAFYEALGFAHTSRRYGRRLD